MNRFVMLLLLVASCFVTGVICYQQGYESAKANYWVFESAKTLEGVRFVSSLDGMQYTSLVDKQEEFETAFYKETVAKCKNSKLKYCIDLTISFDELSRIQAVSKN